MLYRPYAAASNDGDICDICNGRIRDGEPKATITCANVAPSEHELTLHKKCAEAHADAEAKKVVKAGGLMHVVCPRLDGGGASAKLVSGRLLRVLGCGVWEGRVVLLRRVLWGFVDLLLRKSKAPLT